MPLPADVPPVPIVELEARIAALYLNLGKWVGNPKDDAIGAAGTLPTAIGQDPRSRRARAAQMDLQRAQRDRRERRKLLKFELETQARRIELERPFHVIDQVPDTVEFHGGMGHRGIGSGGFGRGIHHVTPL